MNDDTKKPAARKRSKPGDVALAAPQAAPDPVVLAEPTTGVRVINGCKIRTN
jgi:hypothetical protein